MIKNNRTLRKILAVLLIILGIAALLTPVIPGFILIFIGLEILGIGLYKNKLKDWKEKIKNLKNKKIDINKGL